VAAEELDVRLQHGLDWHHAFARRSGTEAIKLVPQPQPLAGEPEADLPRVGMMQVIKDNPSGLTRGEILERMGLKGNKSGEMSVSNAVTALTKANQVTRRNGRYAAA
jgi:hypothetical protein